MARKPDSQPSFADGNFAATASWGYLLVISIIALPASIAIGNAYLAAQHRNTATAVQVGRMQRAEAVGRTAGELSAAAWTYSSAARVEQTRRAFEAALTDLWEGDGRVPLVDSDPRRRRLTFAAAEYLQSLERLRRVQEADSQDAVAVAFREDVMPRRGRFADTLEAYVVDQRNLIERARKEADEAFLIALLVSGAGFLLAVGVSIPLARRSVHELQELYEREQQATRNAESALAHRDELLHVIAHDLRNPIQHILLKAGAMLRVSDVRTLHSDVKSVADVTRHTAHMLSSLLNAASIEHARIELNPTRAPLEELLRLVVEMFEMQAAAKGLELSLRVDEPDLHVLADKDRLAQAMANLVANALKFTPEGGRITVTARGGGGEVEIAVADTGPGIPAENFSRIFERYYTGGEQTKGLGLGLYIAKALVEAHGGRIWVESLPGKGATFRAVLPGCEVREQLGPSITRIIPPGAAKQPAVTRAEGNGACGSLSVALGGRGLRVPADDPR